MDDLRWLRDGECWTKPVRRAGYARRPCKDTLLSGDPTGVAGVHCAKLGSAFALGRGYPRCDCRLQPQCSGAAESNRFRQPKYQRNGVLGPTWDHGVPADWQTSWYKRDGKRTRISPLAVTTTSTAPFLHWKAKLTVGEDYLSSDIFDTFRFSGVSLNSDLSMLPPSLRGYAPEVTGIPFRR